MTDEIRMTSHISPRTFPVQINFVWLENTGESFETDRTELIGGKVIPIKGNGVIIGKRLFSETTYNKLGVKKELKTFIRNIIKTKIIFERNVFILTDIWSTGPYHFYVDMLSKVIELREQFEGNLESIKIVVFDDTFTQKVIIPLFKDLGLENLRIMKLKRTEQYVFFGNNYFVTKPHTMGTNNPRVVSKAYELIHGNLGKYRELHDVNSYKGIYYYRTFGYRKVLNDAEIIRELTRMGFYCISFDELSYIEAYRLMQRTKLFVGIHGGGLTNMMFLPPNSTVIEIKNDNPNPNSHCYWHLARSLKFDYTMFVADTVGESNLVEGKGCDLMVNFDKLKELIVEKSVL
jgi:hypothetical protein